MTGTYICVTNNKFDVNGNYSYRCGELLDIETIMECSSPTAVIVGQLLDNETIMECSSPTPSQFVNWAGLGDLVGPLTSIIVSLELSPVGTKKHVNKIIEWEMWTPRELAFFKESGIMLFLRIVTSEHIMEESKFSRGSPLTWSCLKTFENIAK